MSKHVALCKHTLRQLERCSSVGDSLCHRVTRTLHANDVSPPDPDVTRNMAGRGRAVADDDGDEQTSNHLSPVTRINSLPV